MLKLRVPTGVELRRNTCAKILDILAEGIQIFALHVDCANTLVPSGSKTGTMISERAELKGDLSIFLQHYFCRFDHDLHGIALLERHLLGASPRDHTFDEVLPNTHCDVRHNATKLNLLDGSLELIASRKSHVINLIQFASK